MTRDSVEEYGNPFQDPAIALALKTHRAEIESLYDDTSEVYYPLPLDEPSQPLTYPREEQLNNKEQGLAISERQLEEQREQLQRSRLKHNNFPPCFPVLYLDIAQEIPVQHQAIVSMLYREWLWFEGTLVLNTIVFLCLLFSHPPTVTSAPTDLGLALTELVTHSIASFLLWYRPGYNAYMKEVSLYYFLYFVFNACHILYAFYKAVGIPSTGGAGLILLLTLLTEGHIVIGMLTLVTLLCWLGDACLAVYVFKQTFDHYKAAGHTFDDAKRDAFSQFDRCETKQTPGRRSLK